MARLAPSTCSSGHFSFSRKLVGLSGNYQLHSGNYQLPLQSGNYHRPGVFLLVSDSAWTHCRGKETMLWVLLFHLVTLPKSGAGCVQYTAVSLRLSLGMGLVLAPRSQVLKAYLPCENSWETGWNGELLTSSRRCMELLGSEWSTLYCCHGRREVFIKEAAEIESKEETHWGMAWQGTVKLRWRFSHEILISFLFNPVVCKSKLIFLYSPACSVWSHSALWQSLVFSWLGYWVPGSLAQTVAGIRACIAFQLGMFCFLPLQILLSFATHTCSFLVDHSLSSPRLRCGITSSIASLWDVPRLWCRG